MHGQQNVKIYLCYYRIWCVMPWLLVVGGQVQGSRLCVRDEWNCATHQPPATKALHTICGNNTSIVSSSCWWAYKWPKHVEQFISAIENSVASSWFSSLRHGYTSYSQNLVSQAWISWKSPQWHKHCTWGRTVISTQWVLSVFLHWFWWSVLQEYCT